MNKRQELKAMLAGVDQIAVLMKKKLRMKYREGFSGGLKPTSYALVARMLHEHVERLTGVCPHCNAQDNCHERDDTRRQAVDICNLAMMLWVMQ